MKIVTVFVISIWMLNAQEISAWSENKPSNLLQTCNNQIVEPLEALLYAEFETWNEVCNGSTVFFFDCKDPMQINCRKTQLSSVICSTYMYWIDAFVAGGKRFTCNLGYENITNISKNYGGHSCTYEEVSSDLHESITKMTNFLSEPQNIECSSVASYMNNTLTVLDHCKNNTTLQIVQKYFEQVLNYSPCPSEPIGAGAVAPSFTKSVPFVSVAMFYVAIKLF